MKDRKKQRYLAEWYVFESFILFEGLWRAYLLTGCSLNQGMFYTPTLICCLSLVARPSDPTLHESFIYFQRFKETGSRDLDSDIGYSEFPFIHPLND